MNFLLSAHLVLALAEGDAEPIRRVVNLVPDPPGTGQWANFVRNYDELNLGRLHADDQRTAFEAFAPDEAMRIYGRGIRRRLAPMLEGDRERIELAYSLLFSLPGIPLVVYGDEIGMGEDLSLAGRNAVRTPMQWSDDPNGGFSSADPADLVRPVVSGGEYGYESVNVAAQRGDPESLFQWFSRLIRVREECPEIGRGECEILDADSPAVFAHRMVDRGGDSDGGDDRALVAVHNLGDERVAVSLGLDGDPVRLFGHDGGAEVEVDSAGDWRFDLDPHGYCWVRVGGSG